MLKAVRVEKHPDHGCDTLFRLFLDGELSCNFFAYDEVADELERLLNGEAERQRAELLDAMINEMVDVQSRLAATERQRDDLLAALLTVESETMERCCQAICVWCAEAASGAVPRKMKPAEYAPDVFDESGEGIDWVHSPPLSNRCTICEAGPIRDEFAQAAIARARSGGGEDD